MSLTLINPKACLHLKKLRLIWKTIIFYECLSVKSDFEFIHLLFQIALIKFSKQLKASEIVQSEGCCLLSGRLFLDRAEIGWMFNCIIRTHITSHLFRFPPNPLNGKNFNSLEVCNKNLDHFIKQNGTKFCEDRVI